LNFGLYFKGELIAEFTNALNLERFLESFAIADKIGEFTILTRDVEGRLPDFLSERRIKEITQ